MPELADKFKVTLVEALPNVLPMFSKALIDYTEKSFRDEKIDVRTKTMVKNVADKYIEVEAVLPDGSREKQRIPYGCLVWATGNAIRPVIRDLMNKIPEQKSARRGLAVNEYLVVDGTEGIWAVGDCAQSKYAPTAQVASQQGAYLARLFNTMERRVVVESEIEELKELEATSAPEDKGALQKALAKKDRELKKFGKISSFEYTHQGSLAYIGMDRAVADISLWGGNVASAGGLTFLFWRSAYLSMVFSTRNRVLVIMDWLKVKVFGRDVSRFVLLVSF
jgi:NADH:ubiquinone reductase (non-electrogenic)